MEFLLDSDSKIIPIEVKEKSGTTVTLNRLLQSAEFKCGYKVATNNVDKADKKILFPLYLLVFMFPTQLLKLVKTDKGQINEHKQV